MFRSFREVLSRVTDDGPLRAEQIPLEGHGNMLWGSKDSPAGHTTLLQCAMLIKIAVPGRLLPCATGSEASPDEATNVNYRKTAAINNI